MQEINRSCNFNILHVCDYQRPYSDLTPFRDYPGHIVNAPLELTTGEISPKEVARIFRRPYMGGMNRKGVLATGSREQVAEAAETVLREAPERFMLGADCTVPSETPWDNLKTAIEVAHSHK